jgi:hypothetical protein
VWDQIPHRIEPKTVLFSEYPIVSTKSEKAKEGSIDEKGD